MIGAVTTWYAWAILVSVGLTAGAAVAGLVAQSYRDTFFETIALCAVAVTGAVLALQIHAYGMPLAGGFGVYAVSVSSYALAQVVKVHKERV